MKIPMEDRAGIMNTSSTQHHLCPHAEKANPQNQPIHKNSPLTTINTAKPENQPLSKDSNHTNPGITAHYIQFGRYTKSTRTNPIPNLFVELLLGLLRLLTRSSRVVGVLLSLVNKPVDVSLSVELVVVRIDGCNYNDKKKTHKSINI